MKTQQPGAGKAIALIAACALLLVGLLALGGGALLARERRSGETPGGLRLEGRPLGGVPLSQVEGRVEEAAAGLLDGKLTLRFGGQTIETTRRELGMVVDQQLVTERIERASRSPGLLADVSGWLEGWPQQSIALLVTIDRDRSLAYLVQLKQRLDRPAVDARLNLEDKTVSQDQDGLLLQVYDSMGALEDAAASRASEVALAGTVTPARVRKSELGNIDISTVLGHYETKYGLAWYDNDRTYNLKVGGDKLNGYVLQPGVLFSFNQVVGDRTEKEGYRVAPVIQAGELIDGLAGGSCQISSTLHAAAFFAGLEIVDSTPHSRPSAYITMGLDATVVYPSVDLKLRNPYPFPVVFHYRVNQGAVKVEILGKERPYTVAFERQILSQRPFEKETREDPNLPKGTRVEDQGGFPGYRLIRRRIIYGPGDQVVKRQSWNVQYPPTTEIIRVGTGDPSMKPPPPPHPHHGPMKVGGSTARIVQ